MKQITWTLGLALLCLCLHAAAQTPNPVIVERLQASPTQAGKPWDALDGNSTTYWEALPSWHGMGATLGISFDAPRWVEYIVVKLPNGSNVVSLELIVDDHFGWVVIPGERIPIRSEVMHMEWRISEAKFSATKTVFTGDGLADVVYARSAQKLQIADILFFGKPENGGGEPFKLEPVPSVPGKVFASSVDEPATHFHPAFLFDGRSDFGWGTDHGQQGAGESVALSFDKVVRIEKVRIMDGVAYPDRHVPVQAKRISIRCGEQAAKQLSFDKDLKWEGSFLDMAAQKPGLDFGSPTFVPGKWKESNAVPAMEGNTFVIKVEEVYPGSMDKLYDLQEMEFFDGKQWFRMDVDMDLYQGEFVRAKTKGMAIGDLLDQPVTFRTRAIDEDLTAMPGGQTTLCFRTDGNMLFRTDGLPGQPGSWNFQGAWEHLAPENGVSRVKVNGMLHPLGNNAANAKSTLIEEIIRIDSTRIWSKRLFGSALHRLSGNTLVPCQLLDSVTVDLRYKTADNFMGKALYPPCMPCLMRQNTMDALEKAQAYLEKASAGKQYKFLIWDAYRPLSVQKEMWEKVPDTNYVANPYAGGFSHNKGVAIDLTLTIDGINSIPMGTAFDFFGKEAHHGYKKLPKDVLANRETLRAAMAFAGFKALDTEWWHYRLPGDYGVLDLEISCE